MQEETINKVGVCDKKKALVKRKLSVEAESGKQGKPGKNRQAHKLRLGLGMLGRDGLCCV